MSFPKKTTITKQKQTNRHGGAEPSPLNYSESAAAFTLCNAFSRLDITFRFQSCICVLQQYRSSQQKRIIRTRFQSSYYSLMAEKQGFEPWLRFTRTTPLAGEPLRPLGYFSVPNILLAYDSTVSARCQHFEVGENEGRGGRGRGGREGGGMRGGRKRERRARRRETDRGKEGVAAVAEWRRERGAAAAGKSVWCMRTIGGGSGAVNLKSAWGGWAKNRAEGKRRERRGLGEERCGRDQSA